MTKGRARFFAAASGATLLFASGGARAQTDTNPPLPNVLLLVDTSGSMERMPDGTLPEQTPANTCNCTDNGPGTQPTCNWSYSPAPNRWLSVQTTMAGSIANGFSCVAMRRTSSGTFGQEYQINGLAPYDTNYYLPFHRLVAPDTGITGSAADTANSSGGKPGACVIAPGELDGAALNQGVGPTKAAVSPADSSTAYTGSCSGVTGTCSGSLVTREYGLLPGVSTPVTCNFQQNSDGVLYEETANMRFGLMTFDEDPDPGIGVTGIAQPYSSNAAAPFQGMWSYFPGWNTGALASASEGASDWCNYDGWPAGCSTKSLMAVGARNAAAPPWEGRMVYFPTTSDLTAQENNNALVSQVLLAARPYGATPMAAMFVGAKYFYWYDPQGPSNSTNDLYSGCRHNYVILLTDGAPNLDMQEACYQTTPSPAGQCPFPLPQDTTATLYNNGAGSSTQPSVQTFALGFAVSTFNDNGTTANCSQLAAGGTLANLCTCSDSAFESLLAQNPQPSWLPCCQLQCIAEAGGTKQAYFAENQGDLQAALKAILSTIAANAAARTTPSFGSAGSSSVFSGAGATNSEVFLASFNPNPTTSGAYSNLTTPPWTGDVQRQRYVCSGSPLTPTSQTITSSLGDDFAVNVNTAGSPPREFVVPLAQLDTGTGVHYSDATIRPYYTKTSGGDGLPIYTAYQYAGSAAVVAGDIDAYPDALSIPGSTGFPGQGCAYTSSTGGGTKYLTPAQCAQMLLDFTFAQPYAGPPSDFTFNSRVGFAFGDVYHAEPVAVGAPSALLQDQLYTGFAQSFPPPDPTKTTSTSVTCPTGIPSCRPQVLYVATNDGILHAFWADIGAQKNNELWAFVPPAVLPNLQYSYPGADLFLLDGSPVVKDVVGDRSAGATSAVWHTMLVAGFAPAGAGGTAAEHGYYALDVTNPCPYDGTNVCGNNPVAAGTAPANPGSTATFGPVFLWQLTKIPSTNFPLFGRRSGKPAITTLFFDPGDGGGARDIGVAILPGGQTGGPQSVTGGCERWMNYNSSATYTDYEPPSGYPRRTNVRCWGYNASGSGTWTAGPTDPVEGRDVAIVRLDTGEIIRVFARKNDFAAYYPTDTLYQAGGIPGRVIDTPLDSPMTGTPMVYPYEVGVDATKFFVGDADGTLWKFDVSDPHPANWKAGMFLDLYNTTVDTSANAYGDGQPFQVDPTLSLDPSGNLVVNAASGSLEHFDNTGLELVYSMTERAQTATGSTTPQLDASVNWYINPAGVTCTADSSTGAPGERVSGPMTVFNGTLFFSTFADPTGSGTNMCANGYGRVWGLDFEAPATTGNPSQQCTTGCTASNGGAYELVIKNSSGTPGSYNCAEPQNASAPLKGKVIPGVGILAAPSCASGGTATNDQYVAGNHYATSGYNAGTYSLFTEVSGTGVQASGTSVGTMSMNLPTPAAPSTMDSWAPVTQ